MTLPIRSGPSQKHEVWKGGDLTAWCRWKEDFIDLSTEYQYDNEVGTRRLKKYTARSDESSMVWGLSTRGMTYIEVIERITQRKIITRRGEGLKSLDSMKQEKESVEQYLCRWIKNCEV